MIKKSTAVWLPVVLRLQTEGASDIANELLNIVFGDIAVWYIKEGGAVWEEVTMTALNWLGDSGIYKVQFPAGAVDTVGKFLYWVNVDSGASAGLARIYYGMEEVVENTNDDIAGLINGLNNFNPASDAVLINSTSQTQIDDIETAVTVNIPTVISGIPALVWGYTTRALTSFGALISGIWSAAVRTLTAAGKENINGSGE